MPGRLSLFAIGLTAALSTMAPGPERPPHFGCAVAGTLSRTGTFDADGEKGRFVETVDLASGHFVARRDFGPYTEADGFDGTSHWGQDRSGASHKYDSVPARAIAVSQSWLQRRGWCDAQSYTSERLPDERRGNASLTVWRATPAGGIPVLLRFGDGVLQESEMQLWSNRLVRRYSDWRIVEGVQVPFVERDDDPEDESSEVLRIADARVMRKPPPSNQFSPPAEPHDYEIIGGGNSATVSYEDDGVGRIYVPVFVDEKGPFPFEIDTGGHLIFSPETAAATGGKTFGHQTSTGGGTGIAHETNVSVHQLRIGQAVIRDKVARVVTLSRASNDRGPRPPRAGILGLELFERFAVQLDRSAKTVTLTPLENFHAAPRGIALPIRFIEDAPLTQGSFAGTPGDFEIDSGDAGPAIVEGYWASQHGLDSKLRTGLDWTGGGIGGEYREILTRGDFALGAVPLPHQVVSYVGQVTRGSESTHLQAGVIGESSLYRYDMTYDYGHEIVWIDPKPKLPERAFNRAGLRLRKDSPDALIVTIVIPNSPAAAAGIAPGDSILAIDGKPAAQLSAIEASLLFAAPVGSRVNLQFVPKSGGAARNVQIRLKELLP